VVNLVDVNTPNYCGQDSSNLTAKQERAAVKQYFEGATASAEVDGQSVQAVRVLSNPFAATFPASNIAGCSPPLPAGVYSPSIDEGYYVQLSPLSACPSSSPCHTIHFHGEIPSLGAVQDVTYNLTIVPVTLK
jgi:hypothetical protein